MNYVVALSADEGGKEALALGRMLARSGGVSLTVCVITPERWGHPSPARVDAEYAAYLKQHAEGLLSEARGEIGDSAAAEYLTVSAPSATEGLTRVARERGSSLIVFGSARHGQFGRFVAGGVTNEMLHSSPVPVVLAPMGYRPPEAVRLSRITCSYAGTTRSHTAFDAATQLAMQHGVPLRLATFVVRDRQMYPSNVGYDAERMVEAEWREQARVSQEAALSAMPQGIPEVEARVAGGEDWNHALGSLEWWDGELLVVGSSRLGPVSRVFLGSNATKIVRASPAPVLVIPRGAEVHLSE